MHQPHCLTVASNQLKQFADQSVENAPDKTLLLRAHNNIDNAVVTRQYSYSYLLGRAFSPHILQHFTKGKIATLEPQPIPQVIQNDQAE